MYNEFLNLIHDITSNIECPRILEIGIEYGGITIPMLQFLENNNKNFYYYGIDITLQDNIKKFISSLHNKETHIVEQNSLKELPRLKDKFDLILVDGDHNYYTVNKELNYITSLMHDDTIIICDDYHTPWDVNDYWYILEKHHKLATRLVKTFKTGVLPAIHDWSQENNMNIYHLNKDSLDLVRHNDIDPINHNYCHAVMLKRIKND